MSAFGWHPKDAVVEAIEALAQAEHERGRPAQEILESLLEATAFGVKYSMSEYIPELPKDSQ